MFHLFSHTELITFVVPDSIFDALSEISIDANASSTQESTDQTELPADDANASDPHSAQILQTTVKMTDLLLQKSGAKSAQKHGGTGVDEFMQEIPATQRRRARAKRRRLCELPPKLKQTMGRANILWARGEIEQAKAICMELIRQGE